MPMPDMRRRSSAPKRMGSSCPAWFDDAETHMLRSGKEHLESLRDGRVIYIGSERVDDVTRHPAFRNAAQTVAMIYEMKADPALHAEMTYEEDGGRHSIYY